MLAKPWAKLLRHRPGLGLVTAILLLVAAIGFASYQRLFSSFATYDDEGYVMVSLQQFMAGGALYDEVYSQYGPAYYWLASIFHRATDWPVTHDVTRFKTLAVWLSVSLLAAGWLYRVTRSGALAAIGLLFVSFHLDRLAMEPGHPQELCILAVAACMFLATFVRGGRTDQRVIVGMGMATALCLMTKVNVGLFLLLSISAALLFATRSGRLRSILLGSAIAAMVALPIVIGRHELFSWHGYRLPILLTTAIALASWMCGREQRLGNERSTSEMYKGLPRLSSLENGDSSTALEGHRTRTRFPRRCLKPMFELRHAFCLWGVVALVSLVIATCTVAAGTSFSGLANGMLFQHMSFVDAHYHAPPIHVLAPLAALFAVVVARSSLTGTRVLRVVYPVAIVLVVGAGLRHLVETFQPLYHGSQDRGQVGLLVSYFVPFVWLILLPLRDQAKKPHALVQETHFARLSLCLIAVLQPLIAYPVPGTQMAIGSLALVVALLTAIHDAIELLRSEGRFKLFATRSLMTGLVGLLLTTVLCRDVYLWTERSRLPSLNLAGAIRLRLPEELVAREHWAVGQLRERADTFVCLPSGHNSLYLWSGIEPPTGFNATVWQDLLTDEHQRAIVAAIDARQRVCIVVDHNEPSSLRTHGPLLAYIRENFEPVATHGAREIWQRRPVTSTADAVLSRGDTSDQRRNVKLGNPRAL